MATRRNLIGDAGGSSSWAREFVPPLVRAACAVGVDAIVVEAHPDHARPWPFDQFGVLLDAVLTAHAAR